MKSQERLTGPSRQHSTMLDICRAMYSEKSRAFGRGFTLLEDSVVSEDTKVAESFTEYYFDIGKGLGIGKEEYPTNMDEPSEDTLQTAIERFRYHSSVTKIIATVYSLQRFSFRQITIQEMCDQLIKLDPKSDNSRSYSLKNVPRKCRFILLTAESIFQQACSRKHFFRRLETCGYLFSLQEG